MKQELNEHDNKLLEKIEAIDKKQGWLGWMEIMALAQELQDEKERKHWHHVCVRYNHREEASVGAL